MALTLVTVVLPAPRRALVEDGRSVVRKVKVDDAVTHGDVARWPIARTRWPVATTIIWRHCGNRGC